jgi:hypothetical protein
MRKGGNLLKQIAKKRDKGKSTGHPGVASTKDEQRADSAAIEANQPKAVYFCATWPEQRKSAACERTLNILRLLVKNDWHITMFSAQKRNKELTLPDATLKQYTVDPNDHKAVMMSLTRLGKVPDIAIFDTFITEEFYSHFIHRMWPDALKILDTQDLHSLRVKRSEVFDKLLEEREKDSKDFLRKDEMEAVMRAWPSPAEDKICARELASCYRSDLVFVSSDYEKLRLMTNYNLGNLATLPFFYYERTIKDQLATVKYIDLERRKNFVWIGHFGHKANVLSLKLMITRLWPKILKRLPDAQFHIFGSNFTKEVSDLIEECPGVVKKGLMENLKRLSRYRALLAP